jgi:IstB-like ATP binding protein
MQVGADRDTAFLVGGIYQAVEPFGGVGSDGQLLFRVVAAAYERRALGIASHWPFDQWGRFLPEHTTAVSLLDRLLHHANVVVTAGDSYRMREARTKGGTTLNKT